MTLPVPTLIVGTAVERHPTLAALAERAYRLADGRAVICTDVTGAHSELGGAFAGVKLAFAGAWDATAAGPGLDAAALTQALARLQRERLVA